MTIMQAFLPGTAATAGLPAGLPLLAGAARALRRVARRRYRAARARAAHVRAGLRDPLPAALP